MPSSAAKACGMLMRSQERVGVILAQWLLRGWPTWEFWGFTAVSKTVWAKQLLGITKFEGQTLILAELSSCSSGHSQVPFSILTFWYKYPWKLSVCPRFIHTAVFQGHLLITHTIYEKPHGGNSLLTHKAIATGLADDRQFESSSQYCKISGSGAHTTSHSSSHRGANKWGAPPAGHPTGTVLHLHLLHLR